MSSERAGTPTPEQMVPVSVVYRAAEEAALAVRAEMLAAGQPHGALDREKAREVLERYGLGYLDHEPAAAVLNALEACVVPDPRLARIEALPSVRGMVSAVALRTILRGDQ